MQPFLVVHGFQKVADLRSGIGEVLVFAEVYLLALQDLHNAFRFGIICPGRHYFVSYGFPLRLGFCWGHADLDTAFFEQARIFARRILNAAV